MSTSRRKKTGKVAYFNRELSWLAFNRRVLEQAQNERFPLLERLRFLAFVCSNLDEFVEIRAAGLIQQVESGVAEVGFDGLGPKEQLRRLIEVQQSLVEDKYACWHSQMVPALKKEDIHFLAIEELSSSEKKWLETYYEEQVYPVLTPLAIDPSHPFPQLANKALYILIKLTDPKDKDEPRMAIIPVPRILPRVVKIESAKENRYVFLSDVVKHFADRLFPGFPVAGAWSFRLTRNSDLYIDEEEVENLLQKIEDELYNKRKGEAVRLEIDHSVDEDILSDFLEKTNLKPEYVFYINGPINLLRLMGVPNLIDRDDLKFKPFKPHTPSVINSPKDIFSVLSRQDVLLHHPYESFTPVVDFVAQAAEDPDVFAIKQTLYRTSSDSPIVAALKRASENGKQVTALVELKARFDEANNIEWAKQLEEVGVHVVYGLVGLKTHCKACLVVRREKNGLKRYAHLGTGNYHPSTAKAYTDLSLFTSKVAITQDVADLFNTLTGFAREPKFKKLLVAPFTLHSTMQRLIQKEASNARAGKPAYIFAKVNSLIDQETIDSLYAASCAGVKIDLVVRGICGLVPGVKDMSENITVRSILGRYLEHPRLFYFENGDADAKIYAGSADWMPRNFFRRIEAVFPIENPSLRERITEEIIPYNLKDNVAARFLQPNGSYIPRRRASGEAEFCQQEKLIAEAEQAAAEAAAKAQADSQSKK